jgi:Asp-tRNA(Asn)/Glu-tRNA(Gln) amidotransferase A subunit family amidase
MKRRSFLKKTALVASSLPWATNSIFAAQSSSQLPSQIVDFSATELSGAIRQGDVSCVETMTAYLDYIHRVNPVYNAIVSMVADDELLAQARISDEQLTRGEYKGWMHGMPHAVKDLTAVKGLRFTSGSPMFADRIATEDNAMVTRLRDAGALFIGKTNTPEFGLGSQSYNPVFGATGSAYNPLLTSGGSSGGAASGLGTHMLPVADGSDMMGSLRNPGAFNNVIGFRPSTGLMGSSNPFDRSLSTSGPMGRNTKDTIALLHTMAPAPQREQPHALFGALPGADQFAASDLTKLRIAWLGDLNGHLPMESGILELCQSNLNSLEAAGARVEAVIPDFDMNDLWHSWITLRNWSRISFRDYYENTDTRQLLKPELRWEIEQSYILSAEDIYRAQQIRRDWYDELERLLGSYDFIALPTAQVFPFDKELHWPTEIDGKQMDTYHRWMEAVILGSLSGLPIVNVPVGFDPAGRPMGMQVMGRFGADKQVLEFALAYEEITDHLSVRPTIVGA